MNVRKKPLCRHCHFRRALDQHNGLCQPCHKDKAVRALYPVEHKTHTDKMTLGDEPDAPTSARPGTPEKIEVLRQRAEKWQRLHHPLDGPDDVTLMHEFLMNGEAADGD